MPGPKYVKDFEFPSHFGFSGSATDRMTTPVKSYERSKPKFQQGGPVKDDSVLGKFKRFLTGDDSGETKVAEAPAPPPVTKKGDTVQVNPKSTVDTLKGGQRERQMKELGLKKGGKVPRKMKSSPKKMRYGTSLPAAAVNPDEGDFSGSPGSASSAGGGGAGLRRGGKTKHKYADGGRVVKFANDGIKTSGLSEGNATDQRSKPSNNMNQQTGGKTPLRPGFKKGGKFIQKAIKHPGAFTAKATSQGLTPAQLQSKALKSGSTASTQTKRQANLRKTLVGMNHAEGGPLRRATGGPVTAARGGDVAQDKRLIKQELGKHIAAPKPRGHGVSY